MLPGHAPISVTARDADDLEIAPAAWLGGIDEDQAQRIQSSAAALPGIYVRADERVVSLGHGFLSETWIDRLPRVVLREHQDIADNTDAGLSMARLLEDFVHRFSDAGRPRSQVRIATGYMYRGGLARMLDLLHNPGVTVHALDVQVAAGSPS